MRGRYQRPAAQTARPSSRRTAGTRARKADAPNCTPGGFPADENGAPGAPVCVPPPPHAVDAAIAAPHCGCPRASTLSPSGCEQRIWERPSCPPSERANRAQRRRAERVGGRCTPVQRPAPQRLQHGEASRLTRRRARRDPASADLENSPTHQKSARPAATPSGARPRQHRPQLLISLTERRLSGKESG